MLDTSFVYFFYSCMLAAQFLHIGVQKSVDIIQQLPACAVILKVTFIRKLFCLLVSLLYASCAGVMHYYGLQLTTEDMVQYNPLPML